MTTADELQPLSIGLGTCGPQRGDVPATTCVPTRRVRVNAPNQFPTQTFLSSSFWQNLVRQCLFLPKAQFRLILRLFATAKHWCASWNYPLRIPSLVHGPTIFPPRDQSCRTMSRNAIATGATPLSESDENPPASPILAKLPTADDDNARPCKRQRTAESGPEEAAEWVVHHGSEDDVVALAAQFEAEFLAAFQRTDCDTAHDDKTSAVGEEGPEATTLADELKRSRSPSHHDVNQAPLEPYDSLCHADSGVVQPKAPEQATRATSRVTNSAHKVPAHGRVPSPRPEGADGETAYGEEAATGEAMDVDEPEDTEMDDGASVTSQLSAGFYKDFMHDIAIDLENLLDNFQCPTPTPDASNEYSDPRLENGFSREEARDLRHTLRKWLEVDKSCRPNNLIYHRLDDIYKEINLDASTLVSRDQALVKTLLQLVEEIPVEIFLATLDRGIFYHSPDQWIIARKLLDMDGRLIVREVPVESNLLSPETLPNGDAYKNSRPGDPADPPRFETVSDSAISPGVRRSDHLN